MRKRAEREGEIRETEGEEGLMVSERQV